MAHDCDHGGERDDVVHKEDGDTDTAPVILHESVRIVWAYGGLGGQHAGGGDYSAHTASAGIRGGAGGGGGPWTRSRAHHMRFWPAAFSAKVWIMLSKPKRPPVATKRPIRISIICMERRKGRGGRSGRRAQNRSGSAGSEQVSRARGGGALGHCGISSSRLHEIRSSSRRQPMVRAAAVHTEVVSQIHIHSGGCWGGPTTPPAGPLPSSTTV